MTEFGLLSVHWAVSSERINDTQMRGRWQIDRMLHEDCVE